MIYLCCDENRRLAVRNHARLNGIDYVEVLDSQAPAGSPRQRTLLVRFLKTAPAVTKANFEITGGERISEIGIAWVTRADAPDHELLKLESELLKALPHLPDADKVIVVRTNTSGDYSTYTLHLVASTASLAPPPGIDPLLARVTFSFKVECPSDFDCAQRHICPPEKTTAPRIDYLAKDYGSFRRLMLDRMAQTVPDWAERNAADLGIALVELLAFVGDRLSYAQDAVATEAYLATARRRPSVRRLTRLVDYAMHDGANSRVWVQVQVHGAPVDLPRDGTKFLTRVEGVGHLVPPPEDDPLFKRILMQRPVVFEPLHGKRLFEPLNDIAFYDWGEAQCCLPEGAVRATLRGDFGMLVPGDVLVFEERLGPRTGRASDADPVKRCAVRVLQVAAGLTDSVTDPPTPITEIRWADEDALAFPLCISSRTAEEFGGNVIHDVSHVLGNIVLADHGLKITGVDLGTVPEPHLFLAVRTEGNVCAQPDREAVPPRFRPMLPDAPITQAQRYIHPPASAAGATRQSLREVEPQVTATDGKRNWTARGDLLASSPIDEHFVVEIESDGKALLRFGDGRNGRRPLSGSNFKASYRVGNGPTGNVGADSIAHVVTGIGTITGVYNPLQATGGLAPETMASARIATGHAYQTQERAVTEADYAEIARRHPNVQRAAATIRWNGHGHTVFVTVDRFAGRPVTPEFEAELIAFMEPYRMAGYDLEIDEPRFVSLDLALQVCVKPEHFRAQVVQTILELLSDRRMPDGRAGLFHPDSWTFDQDVWLSRIVARAQAIEGVESVTPTRFCRLDMPDPAPLEDGFLDIGRLEIARLANNPNFPERGRLALNAGGGK
ncbi:putative baseplate assembly protein [Bradyrhizobium sp. USDA 3458]|uniref:putative baseplate assembly protein n=1 Tax=Bradyrhizobium sp. USDA 3458 TaxID=2591461 RepID=UPI001141E487|nr:putative baseplate assembly protein [Bradyrhizobium sp. USDA 3458]